MVGVGERGGGGTLLKISETHLIAIKLTINTNYCKSMGEGETQAQTGNTLSTLVIA